MTSAPGPCAAPTSPPPRPLHAAALVPPLVDRPRPVALLVGQLGFGGSERQLVLFLQECDRRAWSPLVLAAGGLGVWADRLRERGVPVVLLQGTRWSKARQLRRLCRQQQVQVLVSWSSYTNAFGLALLGLGVGRVGSYRSGGYSDLPSPRRLWARLSRTGLDLVVANSQETADRLRADARPGQHVVCVPNAVEAPADPARARARWRAELGLEPQEVLVLGLGRVCTPKNYGRFLEVLALARSRTATPLRAVVGGADSDDLVAGLRRRSHELGLPANTVRWLGAVPDSRGLLCAADVLLLTSDVEGMPNVVLEALAGGTPVVTTPVGGVRALLTGELRAGIGGFDAASLAARLVTLAEDPALRRRHAELGRQATARGHRPADVYGPLWDLVGDVADVPSQRGVRALDLGLSLLLAPVVGALTGLLALAVLLLDGRPVLYRGPRVGRYGVGFEVLKLRTMRAGPGTGVTGADDPRVTRLGRVLRRSKLDELPQLLNVLRGEMSLVGPRPEDPRWVNLRSPDQRLLQRVRPGITSPASLAFRDEERLLQGPDWIATYRDVVQPRKAALDAAYVRRSGVFPALAVLLRTALALLLPHTPTAPSGAHAQEAS